MMLFEDASFEFGLDNNAGTLSFSSCRLIDATIRIAIECYYSDADFSRTMIIHPNDEPGRVGVAEDFYNEVLRESGLPVPAGMTRMMADLTVRYLTL